ncbi:MAG: biotin transporter BioY [Candidatus Obscuribacterales bacterium]|nr:biotin transporter BioY [Candidatus Obscuribacterales bacterium]
MSSRIRQNLRNLRKKSLIGQIVLTLLSVELLFFATFASLKLPTPTKNNLERYVRSQVCLLVAELPADLQSRAQAVFPELSQPVESVRVGSYTAVLPLAVALGYVLGLPLCLISVSIFFLLGIIGPKLGLFMFASGGGFDYWREPGFGYLAGLMAGSWFAARINIDDRKSWRQALSAVGGVLVVHICGLAYLVGSSILILLTEGQSAYLSWQPWLSEQMRNLSSYVLPYDLLFAFLLIGICFPLRWLVHLLTSPDVVGRKLNRATQQADVLSEPSV